MSDDPMPMLEGGMPASGPTSTLGFFSYYWIGLKHFGERLCRSKGNELVSGLIIAATTFLASFFIGDQGAFRSFEVAVIALVGWLTFYAIAHIVRTPWLIHKNAESRVHWGYGVAGIVVLLIIVCGIGALGLWFYRPPTLAIKFPSADLGAKDAQILQLKQELAGMKRDCLKTKPGQSLEMLCRRLSSCPPSLLKKRALMLATSIDGIYAAYEKRVALISDQMHDDSDAQTATHRQSYAFRFHVEVEKAMSEYRTTYQADAAAYRAEMESRIGPGVHDNAKDYYYDATIPSVDNLQKVASDLRSLAGRLPTQP